MFLDCQHIAGALNVEADALSRAPDSPDSKILDSYLAAKFFTISSVSRVSPRLIERTPILELPMDYCGPVWKAFVTSPLRSPPARLTLHGSKISSTSATSTLLQHRG